MIDVDFINPDIFYWRGIQRFVFPNYVNFLLKNKLIANPTEGGLVLGPSHEEGGIQMIAKHDDEYIWVGEVEGYEYIVNPIGTEKYDQDFKRINSFQYSNVTFFEEYKPPTNILIVDCNPIKVNGKLFTKWIGCSEHSQWIVNKTTTRDNLVYIDNINRQTCNQIERKQNSWKGIILRKIKGAFKR